MRTLVKTETSGWFQLVGENGQLADKRVRKQDGDEVYESVDEARTAIKVVGAVNGQGQTTTEQMKQAVREAEPPQTTVADTGKILKGKTITITCSQRGCNTKRVIKPQDRFQVKFCVPHQQEHRKAVRRQKQREKAKARKAKAAAAA